MDLQFDFENSPYKSRIFDPMLNSKFKLCFCALLILLVTLVNYSFLQDIIPKQLKQSLIVPVIKNYSKVPFLSKPIEKIAYNQLNSYLTSNSPHLVMQSAYRKFHSKETALIKLLNYSYCSIDACEEVALVLLYLSSAFDMIDYPILVDSLEKRFRLSVWYLHGLCLIYFKDCWLCLLTVLSLDHFL